MPVEGFGEVTERLRRSTVHVRSGSQGSGSGVIWTAQGVIITNAHVIRGSAPLVELWDGRRMAARILQHDRGRDLAALQIDASGLPAAAHGDSAALRPGELAIAVGNPMGFVGAVSTGVIHRIERIDARSWVISDVRLAPGNSGGPLANAKGEVVGINAMVAGGLGFAVPANSVAHFLAAKQEKQPGLLGVAVHPAILQGESGHVGFVVLEVVPGSSAERASLHQGDILIGAGGNLFCSAHDLENALDRASASGTVAIQFRRGGSPIIRTAVAQLAHAAARAA
jgi:serine protease Do